MQQPSKLNALSIGLSASKLGASVAAGVTKTAYSGITQGINLKNLISELRTKFNTNQQSEIIKAVPLIIDNNAKAILAKNNMAGLPANTIITNKLAAALMDASKSTLNSALGMASFGRQAFGEVSKHLNVPVAAAKKPRIGGKTHKRKNNKLKKSRRRS
jgi:Zn-dependent M16 (insulinase) family peptidase